MLYRLPYQDFNPTTFQEFLRHFQEKYQLSRAESHEEYEEWLDSFHHKAALFYRAFSNRIQLITERSFKREKGIDQEGIPHWLKEEWEEYWNENASDIHDLYRNIEDRHTSSRSAITLKRYGSYTVTITQTSEAWQRSAVRGGPPEREIDEFWFNNTINNPQHIQAELRKLPYQDYLKTTHWQMVREAMLLIGKATCRAHPCYYGGSWYGGFDESELDVHHLSYKNLGNERYNDIVLLCKTHHNQWHQSKKLLGTPNIKIL